MNLTPIFAPDGQNCSDPQVLHWPDNPPRPIGTFRQPIGLLKDPWDAPARNASHCVRHSRPPVTIYDGVSKPVMDFF
jgi:hypothetical protein